jgi:hypothetical protein
LPLERDRRYSCVSNDKIQREAMTPIRFLPAVAACLAVLASAPPVQAATWSWDYSAAGIAASGTFMTTDVPDSDGFYTITAIAGTRNGVAITGLEPAGSAIPGNDPYAVDDLVSIAGPQLTWNGFGYALADGSWANPFSDGSTAWEYLSVPPYAEGAGQEVSVSFSAAPVPEPATGLLTLLGVCALAAATRARRAT